MALTDFQRRLCRLLADNRIGAGESYVAGGAALNELIAGPRISRDIVNVLPADEVGTCVLTRRGELFKGDAENLKHALERDDILFHAGRVRGAFPRARFSATISRW